MAAARPQVTVQNPEAKADAPKEQVLLPSVLLAPIRNDIVHFVHTNMAKNRRQPYAVSDNAGHQHSAESWGTGRAVARIPRVSGGGNSRSGQGAFGNMCRKGRMFAPTKTWRKWHRKINQNQKRYAVVSALAASALPSLVSARGHHIERVPEVPLVVPTTTESVLKTKDAIVILKKLGAYGDVAKAKDSKKVRAGTGKMRNRRYTQRRGPLVIFNEDKGITKAFRNLPGVELAQVDRLNLLQLAPGGHLGRFVIWTKSAFERLDSIWGTTKRVSQSKSGYKLPHNVVNNSDITRIINSEEVQTKVRPVIKGSTRLLRKKNPLTNLGVRVRLNPYALKQSRMALLASEAAAKRRAAAVESKRAKKAITRSDVEKADFAKQKKHAAQQKKNYKRISAE